MKKTIALFGLLVLLCPYIFAEWTIKIDPKPVDMHTVYIERLLSLFSPGIIIESDLKPGGYVKQQANSAYYVKYNGVCLQATNARTRLFDPQGKLIADQTANLYIPSKDILQLIEDWKTPCEKALAGLSRSSINVEVSIPSNAVSGQYKICTSFYVDIERYHSATSPTNWQTFLSKLGVSAPICINVDEDCSTFEVKSSAPTPQPTPTPTPQPTSQPQPTCQAGFIGSRYCKGDLVVQVYRYSDCRTVEATVDNCASAGMKCENGQCQMVSCAEGYLRKYCKGNAVYGTKYVLENNKCVEKEVLVEDCSAKNAVCQEKGLSPSVPDTMCVVPEPSNKCNTTPQISDWKATGYCTEEGEVQIRTISYEEYNPNTKQCVVTERTEKRIDKESKNCMNGLPLIYLFLPILGVVLVIVILAKIYKRRR